MEATSTSKLKASATREADSMSSRWFMLAILPRLMSFLMTSGILAFIFSASSFTVIISLMRIFWRGAAGRGGAAGFGGAAGAGAGLDAAGWTDGMGCAGVPGLGCAEGATAGLGAAG